MRSPVDHKVRVLTESLARAVDRRKFLKQTGTILFGGVAALAAGHSFSAAASAAGVRPMPKDVGDSPGQPTISCSPPGPYCNTGLGDLSGCHGAHCWQHMVSNQVYQCHVYFAYYPAGCWTTASGGGYWTCCDCQCSNGSTCGCAQFSTNPAPRPTGPGTRGGAF